MMQVLKTMMMITGATIVPVIALSIAISWAWISYQKGSGVAVEPVAVVEELIPTPPTQTEADNEASDMCAEMDNCRGL